MSVLLLPDGLLLLSLLFVRPVADNEWPRRLALHALLLSACLLVASVAAGGNGGGGRCLAGLAASLLQLGLQLVLVRRGSAGAPWRPGTGDAAWLLAGLALVAVAVWAVPDVGTPHGLLAVCLAVTLTGLLGAVAARSTVGRVGSLLLVGDALILAACLMPGTDGLALGTILLFQAGSLCALVLTRASAGPAAS